MNEKNETPVAEAPVTPSEPLPEGATRQPTEADPEGDGLTKGQTSPDVVGDVLGL